MKNLQQIERAFLPLLRTKIKEITAWNTLMGQFVDYVSTSFETSEKSSEYKFLPVLEKTELFDSWQASLFADLFFLIVLSLWLHWFKYICSVTQLKTNGFREWKETLPNVWEVSYRPCVGTGAQETPTPYSHRCPLWVNVNNSQSCRDTAWCGDTEPGAKGPQHRPPLPKKDQFPRLTGLSRSLFCFL